MDTNKLKGRPSFPFETIAVAVAFSPKLEALMSEAKHLADSFKAKLLLIHIGSSSAEKEATLLEICEKLFSRADRYRRMSVSLSGSARDVEGEHRQLVERALARDADGAAEALRRHYGWTAAALEAFFGNENGGPA